MWELLPLCVGGPGTLYKLHPSSVSQWYVPYRFRGSPQWERVRVAEAGGGSGGPAIHVPGPPHAAGQRWRGSIQSPGPGRARRRRRRAGRCYESCRVRGGGGRAPCRVPGPRAGGAPGGIRGCASRGSPAREFVLPALPLRSSGNGTALLCLPGAAPSRLRAPCRTGHVQSVTE